MYRLNMRLFFLRIFLLLLTSHLWALSIDSKQPLHIDSESQLLDMKNDKVTFTGNVVLRQGSISITAERLVLISGSDTGNIDEIQGCGDLATFSWLSDRGSALYGEAKEISYQVALGQLIMTDNAVLYQANNMIKSENIRYQILDEELAAGGGPGVRVSTILEVANE